MCDPNTIARMGAGSMGGASVRPETKQYVDKLLKQYTPDEILLVARPQKASGMNLPGGEPLWNDKEIAYLEELKTSASADMGEGNIDLNNRPMVRNPDGSMSTVRSQSFNFGGQEVLLPTVSAVGGLLGPERAVQQYKRTGEHLGKFNTPEEATRYAKKLHEDQAQKYSRPVGQYNN